VNYAVAEEEDVPRLHLDMNECLARHWDVAFGLVGRCRVGTAQAERASGERVTRYKARTPFLLRSMTDENFHDGR